MVSHECVYHAVCAHTHRHTHECDCSVWARAVWPGESHHISSHRIPWLAHLSDGWRQIDKLACSLRLRAKSLYKFCHLLLIDFGFACLRRDIFSYCIADAHLCAPTIWMAIHTNQTTSRSDGSSLEHASDVSRHASSAGKHGWQRQRRRSCQSRYCWAKSSDDDRLAIKWTIMICYWVCRWLAVLMRCLVSDSSVWLTIWWPVVCMQMAMTPMSSMTWRMPMAMAMQRWHFVWWTKFWASVAYDSWICIQLKRR